jgi:chromosome partitioning protein
MKIKNITKNINKGKFMHTPPTQDFMISMRDLAAFLKCSPQALHKSLKDSEADTKIIGNKLHIPSHEVRLILEKRGYTYKQQVIAIQMLKGGVGKTSSALNIAIRATHYGARVLCIDLDQQGNLSFGLNKLSEDNLVWIDIVEGRASIEETIINVGPNLDLIPSSLDNSMLDRELGNGKRNIAKAISQHIEKVKKRYDLIIMDTAPNLGAINIAAACAADTVITPVNPDKYSFLGLKKTIDELSIVLDEFGSEVKMKILFSKFDGREASSHDLLKKCYSNYSDIMMKSFVRTSTEVKNSVLDSRTIYYKNTPIKDDYDTVTREVLNLNL